MATHRADDENAIASHLHQHQHMPAIVKPHGAVQGASNDAFLSAHAGGTVLGCSAKPLATAAHHGVTAGRQPLGFISNNIHWQPPAAPNHHHHQQQRFLHPAIKAGPLATALHARRVLPFSAQPQPASRFSASTHASIRSEQELPTFSDTVTGETSSGMRQVPAQQQQSSSTGPRSAGRHVAHVTSTAVPAQHAHASAQHQAQQVASMRPHQAPVSTTQGRDTCAGQLLQDSVLAPPPAGSSSSLSAGEHHTNPAALHRLQEHQHQRWLQQQSTRVARDGSHSSGHAVPFTRHPAVSTLHLQPLGQAAMRMPANILQPLQVSPSTATVLDLLNDPVSVPHHQEASLSGFSSAGKASSINTTGWRASAAPQPPQRHASPSHVTVPVAAPVAASSEGCIRAGPVRYADSTTRLSHGLREEQDRRLAQLHFVKLHRSQQQQQSQAASSAALEPGRAGNDGSQHCWQAAPLSGGLRQAQHSLAWPAANASGRNISIHSSSRAPTYALFPAPHSADTQQLPAVDIDGLPLAGPLTASLSGFRDSEFRRQPGVPWQQRGQRAAAARATGTSILDGLSLKQTTSMSAAARMQDPQAAPAPPAHDNSSTASVKALHLLAGRAAAIQKHMHGLHRPSSRLHAASYPTAQPHAGRPVCGSDKPAATASDHSSSVASTTSDQMGPLKGSRLSVWQGQSTVGAPSASDSQDPQLVGSRRQTSFSRVVKGMSQAFRGIIPSTSSRPQAAPSQLVSPVRPFLTPLDPRDCTQDMFVTPEAADTSSSGSSSGGSSSSSDTDSSEGTLADTAQSTFSYSLGAHMMGLSRVTPFVGLKGDLGDDYILDALQRKDAHASHGAVLWVGKYRLYRQEEERSSARRKLFGDGDESVQHDAGRQQHFSRAAARSHRPTSAPSTL